MTLYWLTTVPHPNARLTGYDAGQRGWKLHAVEAKNDSFKETRFVRAVCGLLPRHGWGLDLFIDDKCEICTRMTEQYNARKMLMFGMQAAISNCGDTLHMQPLMIKEFRKIEKMLGFEPNSWSPFV